MVMQSGPTQGGGRDQINWEEVLRRRLQQQQRAAQAQQRSNPAREGSDIMQARRNQGQQPAGEGSNIIHQRNVYNSQPAAEGSNIRASRSGGQGGSGGGGGGGTAQSGAMITGDAYEGPPLDSRYRYGAGMDSPITSNGGWYTGRYTEATQEQLAADPNRWATGYSMANGYGRGVENVLNSYVDPGMAYLLSLESGDEANSDDKLGFAGGVYDFALQKSNGQSDWGNPGDVVSTILGQSGTDPNSTPIGRMLYGETDGDWGGQVGRTLEVLQSALAGRMVPEVMGPWLSMIEREGSRFIEYKAMNPTDTRNFGAWLLDTMGPNAGL